MQRLFILAAGLIIGVAASGAVSSAAAKTIKVFNTTHYAVVALQPKKPADKEWQRDLLGQKALGVGKLADVEFVTTTDCVFDLRVTFDDGHKIEKHKVDVCKIAQVYQLTDKNDAP